MPTKKQQKQKKQAKATAGQGWRSDGFDRAKRIKFSKPNYSHKKITTFNDKIRIAQLLIELGCSFLVGVTKVAINENTFSLMKRIRF